jgi:hypothetical protein
MRGVPKVVGLATETTEIPEFFLKGLSELPWHHPAGQVCGEELIYSILLDIPRLRRRNSERGII